jgi:acyl-coenzyme A synthetase/AMP-(fatty) acid ligase
VIGVADELKGQVPLGLVVLKAGVDARSHAEIEKARSSRWCATRSARSRRSRLR